MPSVTPYECGQFSDLVPCLACLAARLMTGNKLCFIDSNLTASAESAIETFIFLRQPDPGTSKAFCRIFELRTPCDCIDSRSLASQLTDIQTAKDQVCIHELPHTKQLRMLF